MKDPIVITTQDGNTLARCSRTGATVSAKSAAEALAELHRLSAMAVPA